jgi:2'-5' RNA ligase
MQLVLDLQQGLKACGFQPEKRAYSPHVTLARKSGPVQGFALQEPLQWRSREFVLVASEDTGAPPRYRVLKRWPLD